LLTWLHPVRGSFLVPLWITEYESRLLPVNAEANEDRTAFQDGGYFPRIDENAFASQERNLLVQELGDLKNHTVGPVVVYLSVFAIRDEDGTLSILPADARSNQPGSRIPFRKVLQDFGKCPVHEKLLILDLMRPVASARIGVLNNDAAALVESDVDA